MVALAAVAMAVFCARNLNVETDITSFIPAGAGGGETFLRAMLSKRLSDTELSRTLVLNLAGPDPDVTVEAARLLAERLRAHPDVVWVRSGLDPDQLEELHALYFPRRHGFLSEDPAGELPHLLSEAGLRERAQRLRRELARPSGALAKRIAGEDPLLAFPAILERVRAGEQSLALRDGVFVTDDQRFAVLLLATRIGTFETARQSAFFAALDEAVAETGRELGSRLTLEQSGIGRFAVQIQSEIFRDIRRIVIFSSIGVCALFFFFLRSPPSFFVAMLPHITGVLVATTVGLIVFERLDGMAVAFGVSLVGVSIDYAIHIMVHHALHPDPGGAPQTARRLRPSLVLGALTTVASFVGLAFTDFPGFQQMGVLAAIGVLAALVASLWGVPELLGPLRAPALAYSVAKGLERAVDRMREMRAVLVFVAIGCVGFGLWGATRLTWVDDPRRLTVLPPELVAEELRVRDRVARFDAGRFVLAVAGDAETALAANDRVAMRLAGLVDRGALGSYRSLHGALWAGATQRANLDAVYGDPELPARLARAYAEVGFVPGAFSGFAAALAAAPPEPLTLEALRESPLGDLVRALVFDLDDGRVAISTYLADVRDPEALEAALEGLDHVLYFDQSRFIEGVYGGYRSRTLAVVASGTLLVLGLLFARYRRWRLSVAAFLPSLLVAFALSGLAALFAVEVNLLHVMGLVLVMGMGVDYGIFVVDGRSRDDRIGTTLLGLLVACLTTILIFGLLALSSHPALNAIGLTAGVGVALSFLLAPLALAIADGRPRGEAQPFGP